MEITPSRALITCAVCGKDKGASAFSSYAYTTNQGKRSRRVDRRCKKCMAARQAAKRLADPGLAARQSKATRAKRPDLVVERNRAYRLTERGRLNRARIQRLRKARCRSGQGDNAAIRAIYAEAIMIEQIVAFCPVFDLPELGKKMHVDHVHPLSKGGAHSADNLQILPAGINMRKGAAWK